MKHLRLEVILTFDNDAMYGNDEEARDWFIREVLFDECGEGLVLHSNEIGDEVGYIKVVRILDNEDGIEGCEE